MKAIRLRLAALCAFTVLFADTGHGQVFPLKSADTDGTRFKAGLLDNLTAPEPYTFTTLAGSAGNQGSADGAGTRARFDAPYGVAVDSAGNVYVADLQNNTIRKVTPAGAVMTLAGLAGSVGSMDETGNAARFNAPYAVAVDSAGNVYVGDRGNATIRKITPEGIVMTLAGLAGSVGSVDGTGSAARFNQPWGVAVDSAGNVYVADLFNHTIRKVTPAGAVMTLAGLAGIVGSADGIGNAARFNGPSGVAVDRAGNVYVADEGNHAIRKVTSTGMVTTLAGAAGNAGSADGLGAARFYHPYGVAVDNGDNVYVADTWNETIRKVTAAGVVTTLAGLASNPGSADGTGSAARFNHPTSVAVDGAGHVYVADSNNHTIRKGMPSVVAPSITTGPQSETNNIGTTVTFTVVATGTAPLTYQWRFKGASIAGASSSSLTLTNVQKINQGAYSVLVSNDAGSATSQEAELAVIAPNSPPIISNISDQATDRNNATSPIPFTVGDAETPAEDLRLSANSSNETLVPNGNILFGGTAVNRALVVLPAPNQSGTTTIAITVTDADGGTVSSTFLLTIRSPNRAPTLSAMNSLTIPEDGPAQTANLTGITSGAPNESQFLTVTAASSNPALIANPNVNYTSPNSTGSLSFSPWPDASGEAIISVTVRDNGGTANGGIDSVTKTFLVTVTPVNDPPSFTKGSDQTVNEDSGAQTVAGWAASPSPGPLDESNQTVSFQVTNDNNALFAVQPAINPNGTLTFTPATHARGVAEVTVTLKDNGGTANGGMDTSAPQTFRITVSGNTPPMVNLTRPTLNASFTEPASVVLEATATDIDGTVRKVEFFQGTTKLGEDTTPPYQWTWSNVAAGSYTLTARATDNTGASATSAPVNIVVTTPSPTVQIVQPANRTIFYQSEPVVIEATATDLGGSVQRIEFYVGTTKLGEATASPYRFTWLNADIGDYALTAKAITAIVGVVESAPVQIAVSSACGQVALVRNFDDLEITMLEDYLYELGVKAVVFDREEATLEKLSEDENGQPKFGCVIWDDLGAPGLSDREVELFRQLSDLGRPLYFIGDDLVAPTSQLSKAEQTQWTDLTHLRGKTGSGAAQQVVINATTSPITVDGKVGTVSGFNYAFSTVGSEQTGADGETVLAQADGSDVLVGFENMASGGAGHRLTQAFRVVSGVDEASLGERKKLFQNAVWWLLNCRICTTLNVTFSESGASPQPVKVGADVVYILVVQQGGECDALAVVVSSVLPSGMEFKEARSERGQWTYRDGTVTFALGRLAQNASQELQIVARATAVGVLTNYCTLRSLNETSGALDDNHTEVITEVMGLRLQVEKLASARVQITINGPAGSVSVLEASTNLVNWSAASTNDLVGGSAVYVDSQSSGAHQVFYRGRLR